MGHTSHKVPPLKLRPIGFLDPPKSVGTVWSQPDGLCTRRLPKKIVALFADSRREEPEPFILLEPPRTHSHDYFWVWFPLLPTGLVLAFQDYPKLQNMLFLWFLIETDQKRSPPL